MLNFLTNWIWGKSPIPIEQSKRAGVYVIYRDPPGYGNGRDYWLLCLERSRNWNGPRTIRVISGSDEDSMIEAVGRAHVRVAMTDAGRVASITRV